MTTIESIAQQLTGSSYMRKRMLRIFTQVERAGFKFGAIIRNDRGNEQKIVALSYGEISATMWLIVCRGGKLSVGIYSGGADGLHSNCVWSFDHGAVVTSFQFDKLVLK